MTTTAQPIDPESIATTVDRALHDWSAQRPRSLQSLDGRLGMSNLGWCRQYATLMLRKTPASDERSTLAADIGTAVHTIVEEAMRLRYPDLLLETDIGSIVATFPSGHTIPGTPDCISPKTNLVVDWKTDADGHAWVKRAGSSRNHVYQRHGYALAGIQAGHLDPDRPITVANVYIDRTGKYPRSHCESALFDPALTGEIDRWLNEVRHAVEFDVDAERDIPAPVCTQICEFFTVCRGHLTDSNSPNTIEDPDLIQAIEMYVEGREQEKAGKNLKSAAQSRLQGVHGTTDDWQVRWVDIQGGEIQASYRQPYQRMDVVKRRKR